MSNNSLVFLSQDRSTPLTTSEIIASALDKDHKDVLALAKKYKADLKEFGVVSFQTKQQSRGNHNGTQNKEIALLNEEQATLLITYMRNSEKVRKFKITLVKAFYEMKKRLMEQTISDRLVQVEHDAYNEGYAKAKYMMRELSGDKDSLLRIRDILHFLHDNSKRFLEAHRQLKRIAEESRNIAEESQNIALAFNLLWDNFPVSVPISVEYIDKVIGKAKSMGIEMK